MNAYDEAKAAIEARRAPIAAGTAGPWDWGGNGVAAGERMICDDTLESAQAHRDAPETWLAVMAQDAANGRLIAAAVNAFAADTEALAEVLERHAPIECPDHPDRFVTCEPCEDGGDWPCPDARAVLSALSVDHE